MSGRFSDEQSTNSSVPSVLVLCSRKVNAPRQSTPLRSSTGRRVSTSSFAFSQSASICARPSTADRPTMRGWEPAMRSLVRSSSSVGPRFSSVMSCISSTTTSPTASMSCGLLTSSACIFSNTTTAIWKSRRSISASCSRWSREDTTTLMPALAYRWRNSRAFSSASALRGTR